MNKKEYLSLNKNDCNFEQERKRELQFKQEQIKRKFEEKRLQYYAGGKGVGNPKTGRGGIEISAPPVQSSLSEKEQKELDNWRRRVGNSELPD
jgi:hypothetical protein